LTIDAEIIFQYLEGKISSDLVEAAFNPDDSRKKIDKLRDVSLSVLKTSKSQRVAFVKKLGDILSLSQDEKGNLDAFLQKDNKNLWDLVAVLINDSHGRDLDLILTEKLSSDQKIVNLCIITLAIALASFLSWYFHDLLMVIGCVVFEWGKNKIPSLGVSFNLLQVVYYTSCQDSHVISRPEGEENFYIFFCLRTLLYVISCLILIYISHAIIPLIIGLQVLAAFVPVLEGARMMWLNYGQDLDSCTTAPQIRKNFDADNKFYTGVIRVVAGLLMTSITIAWYLAPFFPPAVVFALFLSFIIVPIIMTAIEQYASRCNMHSMHAKLESFWNKPKDVELVELGNSKELVSGIMQSEPRA
jgi:hypothetical protein